MSNSVLAWHFVAADRTLRDGSPLPAVGVPLLHTGPLVPCESGLHASVRAVDALNYAPGPILCRVRCGGEVAYHGDPADKLVCRERTILAAVDASAMLHEFACWCAERALAGIPNPDPRSVAAIAVKRRWLKGEVTDEDLASARSAAESAAESVAWRAAESAAWIAAWIAAESAAWSAAESAARSAAESAARIAACGAALSAAESAAWSAQAVELDARALALIGA